MNADILPGMAIVTGIDQGIYAKVEKCERFEFCNEAEEIKELWQDFSSEMVIGRLNEIARSSSFFSYCAGVAAEMLGSYKVGGLRITLTRVTLPMKRGLSSSAAICVLVARAFNRIYKLGLSTKEEMNIAYQGELRTKSRCGRLDQVCAYGNSTMLMEFDGNKVDLKKIRIKENLHWVFADLNAQKNTIRILKDLNRAYPFSSDNKEDALHEALGQDNIDIVKRAVQYMEEGDKPALGKLMTEAQRVFDEKVAPMCPEELGAPTLHKVLEDPTIAPLVYGGKGVGSQGDGSIQFLAKDEKCQAKLCDYLSSLGMKAFCTTIKANNPVKKAIIPVAGFGTRLYPETRLVRKDFMPVVDHDGMVKPAILILLEELFESGIEDVCIILGNEEEREIYRRFFETRLPEEHLMKLNEKSRRYEERILEYGKHLEFVYQHDRRGFGHAVYQAVDFAGGDPVLLLLGDTIYRSNTRTRCCKQFIDEFEHFLKPMVSIHETPLDKVSYYGIITGRWTDLKEKSMIMARMVEKPKAAYAEEHLGVAGADGQNRYWSVFGQYILTKEVFDQLGEDIKNATDSRREIELTSALENVRAKYGMVAVKLDGEMFDLGNPSAYRDAISRFSE